MRRQQRTLILQTICITVAFVLDCPWHSFPNSRGGQSEVWWSEQPHGSPGAFLGKSAKQVQAEQTQKELEEKERQRQKHIEDEEKREREEELKRQKQLEEEERQRQKEEQQRKRQELEEQEQLALLKARRRAKRPLNMFEERMVRRQVRSEFQGGLDMETLQPKDWGRPLKSEVKAQVDDAVKFFSETMRVPATLIGSAALGTLFVPPFKWAFYKEEKQSPGLMALWRLYVVLTAATFCAELTCVLGTSNAHARILELGRRGLALEPTPMDLIMSNLEFEYLTCSLSFFGGLVGFMSAALCRVLAWFRYSSSLRMAQEQELCLVVGGMMLGSLLWWIYLVNVRMVEFGNLGTMIVRYFQLLLARMRLGEIGFVGYAALLIMSTSAASAVHMFLRSFLSGASAN